MRMLWRGLWASSTVLWLWLLIPLQSLINIEHWASVCAFFLFAWGLASGLIGVLARAVCTNVDMPGARLSVNLWWATLTATVIGIVACVGWYGFWQTGSVILGTISVIVGYFAIFAPSIAGTTGVPTHTAIVRSVAFARHVWVFLLIWVIILAMSPVIGYLGSAFHTLLARLLGAVLAGFAIVALVSFVCGRLAISCAPPTRETNPYADSIARSSESILVGYVAALADVLVPCVLPERVIVWKPLLQQSGAPWTVDLAGTTTGLVLAIIVTALLVTLGNQPLWATLVRVISYRLTYVLGVMGLQWLVMYPVSVAVGLLFYSCVALVVYAAALAYRRMSSPTRPGTESG